MRLSILNEMDDERRKLERLVAQGDEDALARLRNVNERFNPVLSVWHNPSEAFQFRSIYSPAYPRKLGLDYDKRGDLLKVGLVRKDEVVVDGRFSGFLIGLLKWFSVKVARQRQGARRNAAIRSGFGAWINHLIRGENFRETEDYMRLWRALEGWRGWTSPNHESLQLFNAVNDIIINQYNERLWSFNLWNVLCSLRIIYDNQFWDLVLKHYPEPAYPDQLSEWFYEVGFWEKPKPPESVKLTDSEFWDF